MAQDPSAEPELEDKQNVDDDDSDAGPDEIEGEAILPNFGYEGNNNDVLRTVRFVYVHIYFVLCKDE